MSEDKKFEIKPPDSAELTQEEKSFFVTRQQIFDRLQDRSRSIAERFETLGVDFNFNTEKLCELFLSLERLDEKWTDELNMLKGYDLRGEIFKNDSFNIFFEQLAVYFIFRHFKPEAKAESVIRFAFVSCWLIGAICEKSNLDFDKAADIVRMYSSEIEYSDENMCVFIN